MASLTTPSPTGSVAATATEPEPCALCGRPECADEVEAYLYETLRSGHA
jgi:hypothetical protein